MRLKASFCVKDRRLPARFGTFQNISDGGYARGYAQGYAEGAASVEDYSQYATTIAFADWNLFGKSEVEVTLHDSLTSWVGIFKQSNINTTVTHLTVNSDALPAAMQSAFRGEISGITDTTLEHLTLNVDLSQSTSMDQIFRGMRHLKVIDGTPIDCSSATTLGAYAFYVCNSLEEVRFVPGTIPVSIGFGTSQKLSTESVQSIIDGLADLTGQTAQSLTFSKSTGQRLTDEQKAAITAKNWTLVY